METRFGKVPTVAVVLGGLLLFAGLFQIAELLTGTPEASGPAALPEAEPEAARPITVEVLKQGDDGYRIEIGGVRHASLSLQGGEAGRIDQIVDCLREGIDRAVQDGALDRNLRGDGWLVRQAERHRVADRIDQIHEECLGLGLHGGLTPPPINH